MNLYVRFFNDEFLTDSVDDVITFLSGLDMGGFKLDDDFRADLETFLSGNTSYPKRYKVRPRIYFTVIKTDAATLEEFKARAQQKESSVSDKSLYEETADSSARKKARLNRLYEVKPGWYDMTIAFKRMLQDPETGKSGYHNDSIRVQCMAKSGADCYNRIIDHLRNRPDVDPRSQFPSIKGSNVDFTYMGETREGTKKEEEDE